MQLMRVESVNRVEDGRTTLSPGNPTQSNMGSPPLSARTAVIGAYGGAIASSAIRVGLKEVRDGGNEKLATSLRNGLTAFGIAGLGYATGGISLGFTAIQGGTQYLGLVLENNRENKLRLIENKTKGSLITFNTGVAYE